MALYAVKVVASLRVRVGVRVRLMGLYAVLVPYISPYLPYTSPIIPFYLPYISTEAYLSRYAVLVPCIFPISPKSLPGTST
jgi:hypothetical protein